MVELFAKERPHTVSYFDQQEKSRVSMGEISRYRSK